MDSRVQIQSNPTLCASLPLSPPEPLRCPLGPWSAPVAPAAWPGRGGRGLTKPPQKTRRGHNLDTPWTWLSSSSRLPRGAGGLGVPHVGVWGGLGDPNPFSRRTSTLSRKLSNQSPRADTQSTEQDQCCKLT
jgi:hypothetical protein